ncbi:MAG: glycosyltransferase family 4 protein, partial [Bacteroidetes bacterium]|nr:glycosyltransferase family 4 protein [Bacteroidota bacterium]
MNKYTRRIFIISASYPPAFGGVATHVGNLSHGLLRLGQNFFVSVLTSGETDEPRRYTVHQKRGRLQVWKIPRKNTPNFYGRRAPFQESILLAMNNWHKIKPNLIHAHDFDSAYIGWMLKIAFRVPLVVTVHRAPMNWISHRYREEPKDCFVEAIKRSRIADYVVVPSKISRQVLLDQGFNRRRVKVIPHGISYK